MEKVERDLQPLETASSRWSAGGLIFASLPRGGLGIVVRGFLSPPPASSS